MAPATAAATTPGQPKPPAADPTREQLQMAFRHYADHHWPNTLDEALARPAHRAVLLQLARRLNRPSWCGMQQPAHRLPHGPVPPTPADAQRPAANGMHRPTGSIKRQAAPAPSWRSYSRPGTHDCKRAAANDKDGAA